MVVLIRSKEIVFLDPNQSAYSAVQSRISMLEKALGTYEHYNDAVEIEYINAILSVYQVYRVQIKCYYLCTKLFVAKEKIHTTKWVAWCSEEI